MSVKQMVIMYNYRRRNTMKNYTVYGKLSLRK